MNETIRYRLSDNADLDLIKNLLHQSDLPTSDIDANKIDFIVAIDQAGSIVGCVGLERHGYDGLLRSLAVTPSLRNRTIGHGLFEQLLSIARQSGVRNLHLLTTTAEKFFAGSGFSTMPRDAAPASIKATAEFSLLCPSSSAYMVLQDI